MFNGIIYNQGTVKKILKRKKGINLFLKSNIGLNNQDLGISVSCDGACLTLTSIRNKLMEFYLSNETIKRSKFKNSKIGDKINLELPLKYGQKISGHICQGHVDTVGTINKIIKEDKSLIYDFKINKNLSMYSSLGILNTHISSYLLDYLNLENNQFGNRELAHSPEKNFLIGIRYIPINSFKDLIIKSNKSVRNKIQQIYERCAKFEFNAFINSLSILFKLKSTDYKGKLPKFLIIIINHLFVLLMK